MDKKLQLAVLCGGQSAEHEVSVQSAKNVIAVLDANKYNIHVIFIDKMGEWCLFTPSVFAAANDPGELLNTEKCQKVSVVFGQEDKSLVYLNDSARSLKLDVAFPVLHGSHGEDGTMQGLMELANIPFVGAGVLGSAVCMDKEVSKRLLMLANIPTSKFITFTKDDAAKIDFDKIVAQLSLPLFVKPSNTGSSVGISKVKNAKEFKQAVDLAFQFDHKILIEEYIAGKEIECSVLGNGKPEASLPGEVVPHHEFYSYEAKYLDPEGATLVIPASLPEATVTEVRNMAKKTYSILCCEGMARVDFFVTPENKIFVNEINTIPGFTQISMYPKLWMATGLTYTKLLDKLIDLALERFTRNRVLVKARSTVEYWSKSTSIKS